MRPADRGRAALAVVAALALAGAPRLAAACPVCGGGANDRTQGAFVIGSLLLSILPLALIGGAAWFLVRRARRIAAEEAAGVVRLPERPARSEASARTEPAARRARAARS